MSWPTSRLSISVADNFFHLLRVQPILGRTFLPAECIKGAAPTATLGNAFWRRQFTGDTNIVGKTITLDKRVATVIGVLPASFDFASIFSPGLQADIFIPPIWMNCVNGEIRSRSLAD